MAEITKDQALEAVKTLIKWIGEDPNREGLQETPLRVINSYEEFFQGYKLNPEEILSKTFMEAEDYEEMIVLKDINIESHCEHHLVPFIGKAHIAYVPNKRVVGISKLARVAEAFARRLQIQEKLTAQIANAIFDVLKPKGVGVIISASHQCLATRGSYKPGIMMTTMKMLGSFKTDASLRAEFLAAIK